MRASVLHLLHQFLIGGSERQFVERLRLHPAGYDIVVGCLDKSGPLLEQVRALGHEPVEFPLHGGFAQVNTLVQIHRMRQLIREKNVAVIHATDFATNLLALLAARASGVKVIVSRGDLGHLRPTFGPMKRKVEAMISACSDLVIANADAVKEVCLREEMCSDDKVVVVRNGLDLKQFDARSADEPAPPFARDDSKLTVAVIGNYWPVKCHRVLVEAAPAVKARFPNVRFVCAGEGAERSFLEQRIAELGLQDTVILLGHRLDVPAVLARCDAACLCSSAEGLSNALMEAMAARLPIVATNVGGNPELVGDRVSGLLVPPGDPTALSNALIELLSDRERMRRWGAVGRARVEEGLTMEAMRDGYEAIYRRLIEGSPRAMRAKAA